MFAFSSLTNKLTVIHANFLLLQSQTVHKLGEWGRPHADSSQRRLVSGGNEDLHPKTPLNKGRQNSCSWRPSIPAAAPEQGCKEEKPASLESRTNSGRPLPPPETLCRHGNQQHHCVQYNGGVYMVTRARLTTCL